MKYYEPKEEEKGKSVFEVLSGIGAHLPDSPCAGIGKCKKCRILCSGGLTPPTEEECAALGDMLKQGFRLACRAKVTGGFYYRDIAKEASEIETDSSIPLSTVKNQLCGNIIAVDIGTTTVALYLVDANTGKILKKTSFVNPQAEHGADVISRLVFWDNGGQEVLNSEINNALLNAATELCGAKADYAFICANTVMQHFLCGEDASSISKLPFTPATLFGKEYSLPFCSNSYIAPCIAAYVGSDISCGAVAAGLDKAKELILYIDIGTNGEIVLAAPDRILCCAAAAGPAFEGAGIECGMPARTGAVSRVWYDKSGLCCQTVGNAEAVGICGSGLIDAAAALLEAQELDETGRLEEERYYLDDAQKVYISQKDIRTLQSAKAAIAAGIRVLVHEMGCRVHDIKRVLIAGGFGSHIDPQNAAKIGLIPTGIGAEPEFLGNCAGIGAVNCALNEDNKARLENFAKRAEYIELSGHKKFNEIYIEEMMFEELL